MQIYMLVATSPGISSKDLISRVGVSQSSISRHIALLGEFSWSGGPGLELVESIEDPNDRRSKVNFLTIKGRQVAIQLARILDPTEADDIDPSQFPTAKEYVRRVRGAR